MGVQAAGPEIATTNPKADKQLPPRSVKLIRSQSRTDTFITNSRSGYETMTCCTAFGHISLTLHDSLRMMETRSWTHFCRHMSMLNRPLILLILASASVSSVVAEHPISITEAQIFVGRNSAQMRIRLFAEDLYLFQQMEADEFDMVPPAELRRGLQDHRKFLLEKVTLRDASGEAIEGQVTEIQPFEIPEQGIAVDELMKYAATYALEYPFRTPPEFLTLQQDISDESFIFPSEMKLALHQAGTEMTYTDVLKPGAPQTVRFDWESAPLAEDASEEDWEKWFDERREATLGITSYSSVYSFIYIEPAEVRHEILIPLATLRTILPMEHDDPAFISIDEQDAVRDSVRTWLTKYAPATLNGKEIKPEFSRIDFYGLDLKDFARQAEERKVSLANGRVGVILKYSAPEYPVKTVQLAWKKYYSSMSKIQSVVVAWPNEMSRFEFSRFNEEQDNVFTWEADSDTLPTAGTTIPVATEQPKLDIPVLSIVTAIAGAIALVMLPAHRARTCLAALVIAATVYPFFRVELNHPFSGPVPAAVADENRMFEQLHGGAYRALDFGTESRIYEQLENSVDGDLLESLYLQLNESQKLKEQGGAVARVRDVSYGDQEKLSAGDAIEQPGFRFRSEWTVSGTVEHWGHIHERQNQFCAVFSVEPKNGLWKITDMQVESQESQILKPRLRRF